MVRQAPLAMIEPPRETMPVTRLAVSGIAQQHAGVDGEVVDALLGLFDQGVAEDSQVRSSATPLTFSSAW